MILNLSNDALFSKIEIRHDAFEQEEDRHTDMTLKQLCHTPRRVRQIWPRLCSLLITIIREIHDNIQNIEIKSISILEKFSVKNSFI